MRRYILSIQDSRPDGRLLEEAFRHDAGDVEFITIYSVESALEYLAEHRNQRPLLILLAARFTNMGALEFLRASKRDERLRMIPILVIGSYLLPNEVETFFAEQASSVLDMPSQLLEVEKMLALVKAYWLGIAGLDRRGGNQAAGQATSQL